MSYGFNQVELSGGDAWMKEPQMRQVMSGIKAIGATDVRMAAVWQFIEPTRGQYKWTAIDRAVNMASEYGLEPTLIVQFPKPYWGGSAANFGAFANALAARYGPAGTGQVTNFEIMNEMNNILNLSPPTAAAYAPWLKAAYTGIKAADPLNPSSTNVITGGVMACLGGFFTTDAFGFCKGLYTAGLQDYFDTIGYHWYSCDAAFKMEEPTTDGTFYIELLQVRDYMVSQGDTAKSVWVTEIGFASPSETIQTCRDWMQLEVELLQALPWVGKFFIYNYRNSGTDKSNINNTWGVVDFNFVKKQPLWDYVASINPGSIASTFTSEGVLSATVKLGSTAPLTGSGVLSADVSPRMSVSAAFAGSGALEVSVFGRPHAPFTGHGELSATVVEQQNATAAFTSEGVLSAEATDKIFRNAGFTGSGTLSAEVAQQRFYQHIFSGTTKPTTFTDFGVVNYRVASSYALNGNPSTDGRFYSGAVYNLDQLSPDHFASVSLGNGGIMYDRSVMALVRCDPSGDNWVGATMRASGGDATQILSCIGGVITQRDSGSTGGGDGTTLGLRAQGNVYTVTKNGKEIGVQWVDSGLLCSLTNTRTGFGFQHGRSNGALYGTQGIRTWKGQDNAPVPTPVTTLGSFVGSGVLSAVVKRPLAPAFTAIGVLAARIDVVDGPRAAPYVGSGTLTATASPRLSVTAPFTGLGTLTAPLTLSEIATPYTGVGNLSATVSTPVLWDSTGGGGRSTSNSVSWTHDTTVTGDDVWVFAELGFSGSGSSVSVKYGSYPMSLIANQIGTVFIYALQSPPIGPQTVTVTGDLLFTSMQGTSVTFTNVGEVVPVVGNSNTAGSVSRFVGVAAGSGARALSVQAGGASNKSVSHTARYSGGGSVVGNGDYVTVQDGPGEADGSVTLITTQSSSAPWAACAVVANPVIPPPSANANYTGSGALSAAVQLGTQSRTATYTAAGAFTATVIQSFTRTATYTGAGVLSGLVELAGTVNASLTGAAVLSMGTPIPVQARTAALTGAGTLTAGVTQSRTATAAYTGAGTLTATAAIPQVNRIATGTGQRVSGSGSTRTITIPITVPAGTNTYLLVGLTSTHDAWGVYPTGTSVLTVVSNIDGNLTRQISGGSGIASQEQGDTHIFTLSNPTPGNHNLVCTFTASSFNATAIGGQAAVYEHVTSLTGATSARANPGTVNINITSGPGDMAFFCGTFSNPATAFDGTTLYTNGSGSGSVGSQILVGEKPGEGDTTVNFSTTASRYYGAVVINLES